MKKNLFYLIPLFIITVFLFLLNITGIKTHIILSAVALLLLVIYTFASRKKWTSPILEIFMRIFFVVAIITGIVLMNLESTNVIIVVHRFSAALFAVLMIISIFKNIRSKKV